MALPPSSSHPEPQCQLELSRQPRAQVGIPQQLSALSEDREQSWDIDRPLSPMETWEAPKFQHNL